jgi:hypothetical protein
MAVRWRALDTCGAIAAAVERHDHPVAGRHFGHIDANTHNGPRSFMAENGRQFDR